MRDRDEIQSNGNVIIGLKAENVKRLKAVSIKPDPNGGVVEIRGRNGHGKTSVLDSICYALGGGRLLPNKPIREGETEASVEVELNGLKVKRRWYVSKKTGETKSVLEVSNADGGKFTNPQKILDQLVGNISFDPTEFLDASPAEQREMLLNAVGLDFSDLDAKRKEAFNERTIANRELKKLRAQLEGMEEPDPDTPDEKQSVSQLIEKRDIIRARLDTRRDSERHLQELHEKKLSVDDEIRALKNRIEELQAKRDRIDDEENSLAEDLAQSESVDSIAAKIGEINKQIESVDQINSAVDARKAWENLEFETCEKVKEVDSLTAKIEDIDKKKRDALTAAEFPITGLEVSDDSILYRGVPLDQASHSEQRKIAAAIVIASDPPSKIVLLRNCNEFDTESYSGFVEMFRKFGYQAWIERVSDSPEGAMIYIEDGTAEYDYAGVAAGSEDGVEGKTSPPAPSENVTSDRN